MEKFDIDIVHSPRRRHGNVNGLIRAYKGMGDVSKYDDFQDATIMTINAEKCLKNIEKSFNTWMA
jgi:hypothetical protein